MGAVDRRDRRRRLAPPPAHRLGRPPADRRRHHGADPAVPQRRRRDGGGAARHGDAGRHLLPQRRRGRDAVRPRGHGRAPDELRRPRLPPGRLPGAADRDDVAPRSGRGRRASGCCSSSARPSSSRPSATATTTASCSSTPRTRSATSASPSSASPPRRARRLPSSTSAPATGITAYHFATPPVRRRRLGRLPVAVRVRHRGLPADHGPRAPAAAGPPDVPARNFVVCSFVPRKFDYHPLAIPAPYNHSNINSDEVIYYVAGNFMSRRGVDIASFTLHPAGHPARTAPGHGRGLDRQGGDRGAGGHGRHLPARCG